MRDKPKKKKDNAKKKCLHNREIEEVWKGEEILYICKECTEVIGSEENTK